MKDCFALLNEARRPWIEPDTLKQKFLALSSEAHPDRVHTASNVQKQEAQDRYVELNSAYNRLRDPKERLLHLIELERGTRPKDVQRIPPELSALFGDLNQACRETDALLAQKRQVTSPLLMVEMFDRAQQQTEKLLALQKTIAGKREAFLGEIQAIDREWEIHPDGSSPGRAKALEQLEELYPLLSYLTRWAAQLQERIVQLAA